MRPVHPLCGYREFAREIRIYHCIAVSERVPAYIRKRMEVVPLLFDHYMMSSDQKHGQIWRITMLWHKIVHSFSIFFQHEVRL